MKIAYLILAHDNPAHLNKLIMALQYPNTDIYVHIDKKTPITFDFTAFHNVVKLEKNIPVYWGGFSQVHAIQLLIKQALKHGPYDYYILLSGADYPIRTGKQIRSFLQEHSESEFVNISAMPENNKGFDRLEYINFEGSTNLIIDRILTLAKTVLRKFGIKRNYPKKYKHLKLYGGSTWWAFTHKCAAYIQNFTDTNPEYVAFYKNTYNPDEMFFQTIIGNSPFSKKTKNAFTYADWSTPNPKLPARLTKNHLSTLQKNELESTYGNKVFTPLFARKFDDKSGELVALINKRLINNTKT